MFARRFCFLGLSYLVVVVLYCLGMALLNISSAHVQGARLYTD